MVDILGKNHTRTKQTHKRQLCIVLHEGTIIRTVIT